MTFKKALIGFLVTATGIILGTCVYYNIPPETPPSAPTLSPEPTPAPAPTPTPSPEDTSGHIYTDGAIECGGDGEPIVLVNNPDATNPTYAELVAFIIEDTTNTLPYIKGGPEAYMCGDFAEEVHNKAETAEIRAAWVGVEFEGDIEGHALNAFETTDKGLVYIDCTGELKKTWIGYILPNGEWSGSYLPELHPLPSLHQLLFGKPIPDSVKLTEWDTVAYVEMDKEYGLIGINEAKSLEYDFYLEYTQKWQEYEIKLEAYNREVEQYNQEISGKVYMEGSSELARIEAWEAELDRQEQILDSLQEELGYYQYELPDGTSIVEDIHIHW